MVISVKAGGTGLNLTQANHVVHFDRWWNPAVEDQATDRAFRIGQKRNVLVHKFVCRGTLEERIDEMIRDKKEISAELFDGDGEVKLTEMNNDQLMRFVSLDLKKAFVCGSELYTINIKITALSAQAWKQLCENCTESVTSVIDLMRGQLPDDVIQTLTDPKNGMFPGNREIKLSCNCPDGASLCKHLAAVLYGVGNRLDQSPELLFVLRGVSQTDLVGASLSQSIDDLTTSADGSSNLAETDLSDLFGIDLVADSNSAESKPTGRKKAVKKKVTKKKSAASKRTRLGPLA